MLGHDVSFANMEAVKNAQQQDLLHKNICMSSECFVPVHMVIPQCYLYSTKTMKDAKINTLFL